MKCFSRYYWIAIAIFLLFFAVFFYYFVKNNRSKNNIRPSELKEAKKTLDICILRYDQDLFSLDINHLSKGIEQLSSKYPPFLIEPDIWNDSAMLQQLESYLRDTTIMALYKAATDAINYGVLLKELETAFGYYKIFYPNSSIPVIITMISGLDPDMPSVYLYENYLLVNLDMYLGANHSFYTAVGLPLYISDRCDPIYLPVDIFKKAIVNKHLIKAPRTTLIEAMITEGKKLYFAEMMFPHLNERFIIGYPEDKYNWASKYLGNVWGYLIEKNELFGKGDLLMRTYVEEAPFTKHFGNDSPGRIGTFVGWKLIQSYMTNNPETTLPELMKENDYQKILNNSKFKPLPK